MLLNHFGGGQGNGERNFQLLVCGAKVSSMPQDDVHALLDAAQAVLRGQCASATSSLCRSGRARVGGRTFPLATLLETLLLSRLVPGLKLSQYL